MAQLFADDGGGVFAVAVTAAEPASHAYVPGIGELPLPFDSRRYGNGFLQLQQRHASFCCKGIFGDPK